MFLTEVKITVTLILRSKTRILCRSYLYDDFLGGTFFLRNNPQIFDFFNDFYFKTVKLSSFCLKIRFWGLFRKKKRFSSQPFVQSVALKELG